MPTAGISIVIGTFVINIGFSNLELCSNRKQSIDAATYNDLNVVFRVALNIVGRYYFPNRDRNLLHGVSKITLSTGRSSRGIIISVMQSRIGTSYM